MAFLSTTLMYMLLHRFYGYVTCFHCLVASLFMFWHSSTYNLPSVWPAQRQVNTQAFSWASWQSMAVAGKMWYTMPFMAHNLLKLCCMISAVFLGSFFYKIKTVGKVSWFCCVKEFLCPEPKESPKNVLGAFCDCLQHAQLIFAIALAWKLFSIRVCIFSW